MKRLSKDITTKIDELRTLLENAHQEGQEYFDEKSEKWQESDTGTNYSTWLEEIEQLMDALENLSHAPEKP